MPKKPKTPSYAGPLRAIKKTNRVANKQARKARNWAKKVWRTARDLNKDVVADLREIMDFQMTNAKDTWDRYRETFWELEDEQMGEIDEFQQRAEDFDAEVDKLKEEAIQFKSVANQEYMAGKASAEVAQAFSQERLNAERALTGLGVNPNSGASQSLTHGIRLAEGAAQAAAGTQAADATRLEGDVKYQTALDREMQAGALAEAGLAMQAGMVDVGQAYPGTAAVSAGQVGTAGAQAVDSTNATITTSTNARRLGLDYARLGAENLRTWTDTINAKFTNKLDLYKAELEAERLEAEQSSGIGSILGSVLGVAKSFMPGFNEGGAIEQEYVPGFDLGGGVGDPNVSGTGGATGSRVPTGPNAAASTPQDNGVDNVPAKLTVGEFVLPKHVVDWYGQKHFQDLIKKAPEQKQNMIAKTGAEAGAVPI